MNIFFFKHKVAQKYLLSKAKEIFGFMHYFMFLGDVLSDHY